MIKRKSIHALIDEKSGMGEIRTSIRTAYPFFVFVCLSVSVFEVQVFEKAGYGYGWELSGKKTDFRSWDEICRILFPSLSI